MTVNFLSEITENRYVVQEFLFAERKEMLCQNLYPAKI